MPYILNPEVAHFDCSYVFSTEEVEREGWIFEDGEFSVRDDFPYVELHIRSDNRMNPEAKFYVTDRLLKEVRDGNGDAQDSGNPYGCIESICRLLQSGSHYECDRSENEDGEYVYTFLYVE